MEKMWNALQNIEMYPNYLEIIVQTIMMDTYTIGDIRPYFDRWSESDIRDVLEMVWYLPVAEEDNYEESEIGERDNSSYCAIREAYISMALCQKIWESSNKKRKFF